MQNLDLGELVILNYLNHTFSDFMIGINFNFPRLRINNFLK